MSVLWKSQGPFWQVCCGKAAVGYSGLWRVCCGRATTLGYSRITLVSVQEPLSLLMNHFGDCAVEKLLWATQDFGYSGITLASVL